jgi:hypothetical protein
VGSADSTREQHRENREQQDQVQYPAQRVQAVPDGPEQVADEAEDEHMSAPN